MRTIDAATMFSPKAVLRLPKAVKGVRALIASRKALNERRTIPRIAGGSHESAYLPANARSTTSFEYTAKRLEENHGIDRQLASERLHQIKRAVGRGPADDVVFDRTGSVYDPVTSSLMQQQADAFQLPYSDLELEDIQPERDLL